MNAHDVEMMFDAIDDVRARQRMEQEQRPAVRMWNLQGDDGTEYSTDPCPFCGSEHVEWDYNVSNWAMMVRCLKCGARGPEQHQEGMNAEDAERKAVKLWNRRTT